MADTYQLSPSSLVVLFAALRAEGRRILAPVEVDDHTALKEIQSPSDVSAASLQSTFSAKGMVFPKVERLMSYTLTPGSVELQDAPSGARPTVVFGLRPCEAGGFAALDAVFNWDTRDRFFNERMDALAVIGMSCTRADEACFCTSVGGGPGETRGSDILLTPLEEGFLAEVLTTKGRSIQALAPELFVPIEGVDKASRLARLPVAFDAAALTAKLPNLFDHEIWMDQSLRCVGCGACAFVCPTCACFDIQEEADARRGERLRCWDSCGFSTFTLHASGHNPRTAQGQRWRQRVYHKFSYYPKRHGMLGCVGCGKCTRACPVDMNLREHLIEAAEMQS